KQLNDRIILLKAQKDKLESLVKVVAPDHNPLPPPPPPKSDVQPKSDNLKLNVQEKRPKLAKQSSVDAPDASRSPEKPRAHVTGKRQAAIGPTFEDSADAAAVKHARVETTVNNRADADRDADWRPPTNQTGDGRTSLNEKYGY
ncbi:hypothetical protein H4R20_007231, partial [Coemansia guatemalensis]